MRPRREGVQFFGLMARAPEKTPAAAGFRHWVGGGRRGHTGLLQMAFWLGAFAM